jgi:2'-5' RNA ligase
MRAFASVELDDAIRAALAQVLQAMQAARPPVSVKWVSPQLQHLTLHFFGDIPASEVEHISQALQRATAQVAPFDLALGDLGCFPNIFKPNVLWVGVRDTSGGLKPLQRLVSGELERIGHPPEARGFAPHLTLARVPREVPTPQKKALGEWFVQQAPPPQQQAMRVTHVHLIQSELQRTGPRYTPLFAAELRPTLTSNE